MGRAVKRGIEEREHEQRGQPSPFGPAAPHQPDQHPYPACRAGEPGLGEDLERFGVGVNRVAFVVGVPGAAGGVASGFSVSTRLLAGLLAHSFTLATFQSSAFTPAGRMNVLPSHVFRASWSK